MNALHEKSCINYSSKKTTFSESELKKLISQISNWKIEFHCGKEVLIKDFRFSGFQDAFAFTSKIADISEKENHHPKIITEWGKVTVLWWSHKIDGLHINDFIMAAKTDMIVGK